MPSALDLLKTEFQFDEAPSQAQAQTNSGSYVFRNGRFEGGAIDSFSIHADGVVIASKSPAVMLEMFLDRFKNWASKELDVNFVETHEVNRFYSSHITFRSASSMLKPLDALNKIKNLLEKELEKHSNYSETFHPYGIFMAVEASKSLYKPTQFGVERKAGADFSQNQYYSSAPLPTQSHLKVLEALESLLT